MIFVYGKSSSGKSEVAESIACTLAGEDKKLIYIATMESVSAEAQSRIARHRALREGKGFTTIEKQTELLDIIPRVKGSVALLECMSNLVANYLYSEYKDNPVPNDQIDFISNRISKEVIDLSQACQLVVVSNDIFGMNYIRDEWCDGYMRVLAKTNRILSEYADVFMEVTLGIPCLLKGDMFWRY